MIAYINVSKTSDKYQRLYHCLLKNIYLFQTFQRARPASKLYVIWEVKWKPEL